MDKNQAQWLFIIFQKKAKTTHCNFYRCQWNHATFVSINI